MAQIRAFFMVVHAVYMHYGIVDFLTIQGIQIFVSNNATVPLILLFSTVGRYYAFCFQILGGTWKSINSMDSGM